MRKFLVSLLTTLFVSGMPIALAYTQSLAATSYLPTLTILAADDTSCQTYSQIFENDEFKSATEANQGKLTRLTAENAKSFVLALEAVAGPAPFPVDEVVIVETPDSQSAGVAYFSLGCLQGMGRIPESFVLSTLNKV